MTTPKVAVLLSAYNGEKYIGAQINSILAQEGVEIELYVRDDGSVDGTRDILREYETEPRIHVEYGKNLGFIRSFLRLLTFCDDAVCYAFSDQDDVWLPHKLRLAYDALREETSPALYCSNYELCDGSMAFLSSHTQPKNVSFANCLTDCAPLGFCTVINRAARELIVRDRPLACCGHDWWCYLVCESLGRVIMDDTVSARYRRHERNVSSAGMGFLRFQIWRFKKFFLGGYFKEITAQLREFDRLYGRQLSPEQQKLLSLFTQKTFSHAITKALYSHPFRQNVTDEVFLRLCFLLGRL